MIRQTLALVHRRAVRRAATGDRRWYLVVFALVAFRILERLTGRRDRK